MADYVTYASEKIMDKSCDLSLESAKKSSRLSLWNFLLDLLGMPDSSDHLVIWTDQEKLEFRFVNSQEVAFLWGRLNGKDNMTYAKFSRAIRYYYGKGVLEKVPNKRFHYYFVKSPKTKFAIEQTYKLGMGDQKKTLIDSNKKEEKFVSTCSTNENVIPALTCTTEKPNFEDDPDIMQWDLHYESDEIQLPCPVSVSNSLVSKYASGAKRKIPTIDDLAKLLETESISTAKKPRVENDFETNFDQTVPGNDDFSDIPVVNDNEMIEDIPDIALKYLYGSSNETTQMPTAPDHTSNYCYNNLYPTSYGKEHHQQHYQQQSQQQQQTQYSPQTLYSENTLFSQMELPATTLIPSETPHDFFDDLVNDYSFIHMESTMNFEIAKMFENHQRYPFYR